MCLVLQMLQDRQSWMQQWKNVIFGLLNCASCIAWSKIQFSILLSQALFCCQANLMFDLLCLKFSRCLKPSPVWLFLLISEVNSCCQSADQVNTIISIAAITFLDSLLMHPGMALLNEHDDFLSTDCTVGAMVSQSWACMTSFDVLWCYSRSARCLGRMSLNFALHFLLHFYN